MDAGPTEIIFEVERSPEGGYEARPLGHSIFTQADTLDQLREVVRVRIGFPRKVRANPPNQIR